MNVHLPSHHKRNPWTRPGVFTAAALLALTLLLAGVVGRPNTAQPQFARYSGSMVGPDRPVFDNTTGKTPATPGKQPWMVSLQLAGAPAEAGLTGADLHICGGALIAPQWVMTAAHCVDPSSFFSFAVDVVIGAHDLNGSAGERIAVLQLYVHEDTFIPHPVGGQYMDVALLRLARPATLGKPIALQQPSQAQLSAPGVIARLTGWGSLAGLTENFPTVLHQGNPPIVTQAQCAAGMRNVRGALTADMICAGTLKQFNAACYGDSGGPLVVPDGKGGELLAGVVSFGPLGCGMTAGEYTVYHRVTASHAWATAIMNGQMPEGTEAFTLSVAPWELLLD